MNKKQIVIMIETDDGIKFGGYVEDENTFLFTFKDNQPKKCDILNKNKGFNLYRANYKTLFEFGNGDIVIFKSNVNKNSECHQNNDNYDYKGIENSLIGRKHFRIKHIQVFQMKLSERIIQKKINELKKKRKQMTSHLHLFHTMISLHLILNRKKQMNGMNLLNLLIIINQFKILNIINQFK